MTLRIEEAISDRWDDFATLMGPRGGAEGCWCMLWRLSAKDYKAGQGDANREAMRDVMSEGAPGLLAYDGGTPVGWCSVAPRAAFPRLESSRNFQPVDETPVWCVTCFFVAKTHRGQGIAAALLDAACGFAQERGASVLEGYPVDPKGARDTRWFAWTGYQPAFERVGFVEAARRSPKRPVMRKALL